MEKDTFVISKSETLLEEALKVSENDCALNDQPSLSQDNTIDTSDTNNVLNKKLLKEKFSQKWTVFKFN